MTGLILEGRALAKTLREELREGIGSFTAATGVVPSVTVVRVEGDPSSERYLRTIRKSCNELGIRFAEEALPADISQEQLEATVRAVNNDPAVHGLLLHLPLPPHFNATNVIAQIDPFKDVDGVHPYNAGLLAQERPRFVPNTPAGGMELLKRYGVEVEGKRTTVIGRSVVVGKPMALMLMAADATVTICHLKTQDLAAAVRDAEILVCAAGEPGLVTGDMLTPGVVIVDFGINVLEDGRVVGDVEFASAVEVAGAITPVPGGTGPVTNMMLLRNVLRAAQIATGVEP
ncbi:MAG TPA: bifunctional 5,10-methylenetetrahydrofolate dehydrogenase/5,10-methenyltetrahydrofolate cyclohydrolase [Roseiflexaceae bacterium]|nr:bifunctional 5,10-methylenetetrahydrofolate dehydrogenase/5,10-methenyltetrahydrofolate cyclohydrolase [Roseiflexaceae bacterium]